MRTLSPRMISHLAEEYSLCMCVSLLYSYTEDYHFACLVQDITYTAKAFFSTPKQNYDINYLLATKRRKTLLRKIVADVVGSATILAAVHNWSRALSLGLALMRVARGPCGHRGSECWILGVAAMVLLATRQVGAVTMRGLGLILMGRVRSPVAIRVVRRLLILMVGSGSSCRGEISGPIIRLLLLL